MNTYPTIYGLGLRAKDFDFNIDHALLWDSIEMAFGDSMYLGSLVDIHPSTSSSEPLTPLEHHNYTAAEKFLAELRTTNIVSIVDIHINQQPTWTSQLFTLSNFIQSEQHHSPADADGNIEH
jgi:hypothetical protein